MLCSVASCRVYIYLEVSCLGHAMGRLCSFQNCKNNSIIKTKRFFHFRKHDVNLWSQLCGIEYKNTKNILKNNVICSDPFSKSDLKMAITPLKYKSRLKYNCFPKSKGEL